MAETLQMLSVIAFALAGVFLVLSGFLWFFLQIPKVIGDLTGRTARKSIEKMRTANEKSGAKSYRESKTNAERGKLTGTMPGAGRSQKRETSPEDKPETGMLKENMADVLGVEDALAETTGLLIDEEATAALPLVDTPQVERMRAKEIHMLEEIVLIHTDEEIAYQAFDD